MDPSAAFTLRDFLQYVMPVLLAGCMYAPLVAPNGKVTPEGIIFGAIILSYIIWSPMYGLAQSFYKIFPFTSRRTRTASAGAKATLRKWNQDELRYLLTSDEREYLYSHGSFAALYAVAGLHLFIYAGINLFLLVRAVYSAFGAASAAGVAAADATLSSPLREAARILSRVTTPSVADFRVNTLFLFSVSALLSYFSYQQYMLYYELLFKEGGQYDQLAERHFKTNDRVARSVRGRVKFIEGAEDGKLFRDADVTLRKKDGTVLGKAKVDEDGRFEFIDKFAECWVAEGDVHLDTKNAEAGKILADKMFVQKFIRTKGQVPYIELRIARPKPPPLPAPPLQSGQ